MNKMQWDKLSTSTQQVWDSIDDTDKQQVSFHCTVFLEFSFEFASDANSSTVFHALTFCKRLVGSGFPEVALLALFVFVIVSGAVYCRILRKLQYCE